LALRTRKLLSAQVSDLPKLAMYNASGCHHEFELNFNYDFGI